MKRIFSISLSIIMLFCFAFQSSAVVYAKNNKPKATYITGTSAVDGGFKVKYKTYDSVDGYQVRYSTKHNFDNDKKVKIKDNSKGSKTVKGLKAKTTYYVKVRTYKKDGDKTVYSSWSDSEPVYVKKSSNAKKKSTSKKSASVTYYWVENGEVYHISKDCTTLKRSKYISSGKSYPTGRRACKVCS